MVMRRVHRICPALSAGFALLATASCRDYDLFKPGASFDDWHQVSGGAAGLEPLVDGDGADAETPTHAEAGGQGGGFGQEAEGTGRPGPGGAEGDAGTAGKAGGGGEAGEAGAGGTSMNAGASSVLGTVSIHTGGKSCAGTLQTNAWVLTAGHCIPKAAEPKDVSVALGGDLHRPQEVAQVAEIVRFGDDEAFHDLALLRLARPFTIADSTTGYRRSYYPLPTDYLWNARLYCLGWDMSPSEGSATTTQSGLLEVADVELATTPQVGAGTTLWLLNNAKAGGPETGRITQAADEGGGCFVEIGAAGWFQVAVQLENPRLDRDGEPNPNLWSRAASLTDSATRNWMLRAMLGRGTVPQIKPARGMNALVEPDGEIAMLWIDDGGRLLRARLNDTQHVEDLGTPEGVAFVEQRPAGALLGNETLVVAYGDDRQLWYRSLGNEPSGSSNWTLVESAVAPSSPAGLITVDGVPSLFALGAGTELRQAKFEDGAWRQWLDLGGLCMGVPSAASWGSGRIDIMLRSPNNYVWQRAFSSGTWLGFVQAQGAYSLADPLIVDSGGYQVDMFFQDSNNGNLSVGWNNWYWLSEWLDSGVPSGKYLAGVSRASGRYDLFISEGVQITHLWWPR